MAERTWWGAAIAAAVFSSLFVLAGLLPAALPSGSGMPAEGAALARDVDAELGLALAFEAEVLDDIATYRRPRRIVGGLSRALAVLVPLALALLIVGPQGERLERLVGRRGGVAGSVGLVVASAVLITAVVRLPLSVWAGVVQDGAWGFRTRSTAGWLLDHATVVGSRALIIGLLTAAIVLLVRRHPRTWPARLTVAVAVLGPLALLLHPLVVHPLLLPTGPLPEGPHRDAVVAVAVLSRVPDVPVLLGEASLRTTRRNAVVTGLGPTQRIVLHDTLLDLGPREVAAITAHELAHVERRDPLRGVLAPVPVVLLVGVAARRRLGRLPVAEHAQVRVLAALAVFGLAVEAATVPFAAAMSRTVEHRTDVRAIELSGDVDAYVTMLRAFVIDGLAEPEPPRWSVLLWATHPTPATRIGAVLEADARLTGPIDLATR